ncbi:MAG: T9SS type A sorting domain-containing protein [Candidatus Eisenbacteria bacterium]|nr:T9SS type A sorting domain-containing protein [Candidatus Eisenbacteria bacterium]
MTANPIVRAVTYTALGPALLFATAAQALDGPQFESPPVHPVELSEDGSRLYAVHQADHRLLVFDLTEGVPERIAEVLVGLEPISVRERVDGEVWVVNHLSDSISILDMESGQIVRTLVVGDEPTDVVFAGEPERAFVCVSQENLVRVYDPADLDAEPTIVPLAMEEPLALGVSPDQKTVWVAAMNSGNQTTIVDHDDVIDGGGPPPSNPPIRPDLPNPPATGLIVSYDGTAWVDETGRSWSEYIPYTLLDYDVVGIDTRDYTSPNVFHEVGTTLFGLAVGPDGRIYVSNQEAFNEVRFEQNVKAQFVQNRVTVVDPASNSVLPRHLNEHIDYDVPQGSDAERALSLSIPTSLAVASTGEVYVAAFGSAKIGVLGSDGSLLRRIDVGDGPCGLALDEARGKLYVVRRIPGALDVVDLSDDSVLTLSLGFDPTPEVIHAGRKMFYDGRGTSAHGDLSCASCHVFGGTDHLAWDLGDPEGDLTYSQSGNEFHPMKGPLMTQSLQSLTETTPFHWRGDRPQLIDFNGAFVSLMGREGQLFDYEFADLESFIFSLAYPPNPYRNLDGSLSDGNGGPSAEKGSFLFQFGGLFGGIECTGCHTLPHGQNGVIIPAMIFNGEQDLDVPQLQNLYEKRGFDEHATQNVRGFGYTHDGAMGSIDEFLDAPRFNFERPEDRLDVIAYLMQFDTGVHAAVGAQWTMDGTNETEGITRLETIIDASLVGPIGVIAKGRDGSGDARGWTLESGFWRPDRESEETMSLSELLALAGPGHELTFTAVYPGTERRLGIDRDLDGYLDRDEIDMGTDPGDPEDPGAGPSPSGLEDGGLEIAGRLEFEPIWPNPARGAARIAYTVPAPNSVSIDIHDVMGRRLRSESFDSPAGRHEFVWDLHGDDRELVPSGLYFVRVTAGGSQKTQRVVVGR